MKKMKILLLVLVGSALADQASAQAPAPNNAFGDNQVQVEPGVFAIYAGDLNQDGYVDGFDYSIFEADNLSFASGYLISDINGDGFTDGFDYSPLEANNLNFVAVVQP